MAIEFQITATSQDSKSLVERSMSGTYNITRSNPAIWKDFQEQIESIMFQPPNLPFASNAPLESEHATDQNFANNIEQAFTDKSYVSYVVMDSTRNAVAGIIVCGDYSRMYPSREAPKEKTAYIYAVGTNPEYNGLGFSALLFDQVSMDLVNLGYKHVELHAHKGIDKEKGYAEILKKTFYRKKGSILNAEIIEEEETRVFWPELGIQTRFMINLDRYVMSRNLV